MLVFEHIPLRSFYLKDTILEQFERAIWEEVEH